MKYIKPYLKLPDQVSLLKKRGLIVTDAIKAERCLERIGYYRLSAYWYPFRKSQNNNGTNVVSDDFKANTSFEVIMDLYVFDKKLRMLMLDALERIEVSIRTSIALEIGQYHPLAYRSPKYLHGNFAKKFMKKKPQTKHQEWLSIVDKKFSNSKEDFVKHFKKNYPNDHLPIWISVELWDFGAMSYLYGGLQIADKNQIAQKYNIPSGDLLESWVRSLGDIRNICAHHSRLWNRPLVNQPKYPQVLQINELDHLVSDQLAKSRIYGAIVIILYLLRTVHPSTTWKQRLIEHLKTFPTHPEINLKRAGFPQDWEKQKIWE